MKIALTGHRPQRLDLPEDELSSEWKNINNWLTEQIVKYFEKGIIENDEELVAYSGMASGCDIAFGMRVSLLKKMLKIKLICVLPCKDYNSSHVHYEELKKDADGWIELSDSFYKGCDNMRDQYLVDKCDVLLAIWDGKKSGGVWSTICKAKKAGKEIIYCPNKMLESK